MIVKVTKRGPMAYFWMGVFRGIEAILSVLSCGAYRKLTPKTKLVAVVSACPQRGVGTDFKLQLCVCVRPH